METLHKGLRSIRLFDGIDVKFLELDAQEKGNIFMSCLPMFFADFSAPSEAIIHLLLPTVKKRSKTILAADEKVAMGVVKLSKNEVVEVSVHYKAGSGLGTSAFLANVKVIWHSSRVQERTARRGHDERSSVNKGRRLLPRSLKMNSFWKASFQMTHRNQPVIVK